MDTNTIPVAEEQKAFPVGLIFDLALITIDFMLGWIWPRILPINGEPGQHIWPGVMPLLGVAALLYIIGLWLYRKPLSLLDEKALQNSKFRIAIKKSRIPILILSQDGRRAARLSFDLFSQIGFHAILLVALVGNIFFLVNNEITIINIIIALSVFIGILAVAITVIIVFFSVGKGTPEKDASSSSILPAALMQLPLLLCLMGIVSAIVGNTPLPPIVDPSLIMTILQIPMFAALFLILSYPILYAPRRLLNLPWRGSLPNWLFWLLLLISYGIRLGLERYAH
jgi:hypothetical protein